MDKFKPKIRISLLDENGFPKSDRLVDQTIEFGMGPKEKHDGPIRLDVTLITKQDIDDLKSYLDMLRGDLPIREINQKGRPSSQKSEINSPREDILLEIEELSKTKNQDDIIEYLRKLGFVFLLTEEFLIYFENFKFDKKDIGEPNSTGQYPNSLSWLVRRIKTGKDIKTDKYDPQIIFGIQMISGRKSKIVPYLYKERKDPFRAIIPEKNSISFSNTEMTKFPPYMIEEERLKFSTEMRILILNKDKKPSKFFLRWHPDVVYPESIKPKIESILAR